MPSVRVNEIELRHRPLDVGILLHSHQFGDEHRLQDVKLHPTAV